MENTKTEREKGLEEYISWRRGPWRGYYIVGRFLIHRYGLLDEDLKIISNERNKYRNMTSRKRIKKRKEDEKLLQINRESKGGEM